MTNDLRPLNLAICKKRTDLVYTNTRVTLPQLIDRLKHTTKTSETYQEYLSMPKDKQGEIKDVGGFVSGYLKNGSRKINDIVSKSIITLDIDDKASQDVIDTIRTFTTFETILYGTHKYTNECPRCRVLIPLRRDVTPTEYEYISRVVAKDLCGIDTFDPTTFQPNRMMYWPSTPKDIDYYFEEVESFEWLDPDIVLNANPNWQDRTTWPRTQEELNVGKKGGTGLLKDPTLKDNIVGAFCAVYDPETAIEEFLSDVYKKEPSGRYTYIPGSSSNGLRIYEDTQTVKCEDATDPANIGTSINSFDLVRIHKFGDLDKNVKPNTPINKYPSYIAMEEFASNLTFVKKELKHRALKELGLLDKDNNITNITEEVKTSENKQKSALKSEKLQEAIDIAKSKVKPKKDAKSILATIQEKDTPSDNWLENLTFVKRGGEQVTEPTSSNILLILNNDPKLKGIVGLDLFKDMPTLLKPTPWKHSGGYEFWTDADDAGLRIYLEDTYKLEARQKINDCLSKIVQEHAFHPVKKFIEEVKWDGIERVETLFIDYLGAEDTTYVRTITRKALVAAVARIYEPGIKFDYMPILVGHQGIGKSLLIKKLGDKWTQDTIPDLKNQKMYEALDGAWIVEMGELACMTKADRETIKMYITKTEDTYRKAYQKNISVNRRTCIFIGTTNESDFLNDTTGNRRFYPIRCLGNSMYKPWNLTNDEIHQIWAEAYELYLQGEQIMDIPEEVSKAAEQAQEEVTYRDDLTGIIEEWLDKEFPRYYFSLNIEDRQLYLKNEKSFASFYKPEKNFEWDFTPVKRTRVCAYEIWCECLMNKYDMSMPRADAYRINQILKSFKKLESIGVRLIDHYYGKQRCFKIIS